MDPGLAALDAHLTQRAEAFERDWTARAAEMERRRARRHRRATRQFWFLFVLLFASFILLAYRTETTADALREGLHDSCQARVAQEQTANESREELVRLVVEAPDSSVPADQQQQTIERLLNGLLLPVEDCGPDPTPAG